MARILSFAPFAIGALAVFFPRSAALLALALGATLLAMKALGWRNGTIAGLLFLAGPLLVRTFSFNGAVRFAVLAVATAMARLFLTDVRAKARGAPLLLGRLELFFSTGGFAMFAAAFAAVGRPDIPPAFFLALTATVAALGVALLRVSAARARGAPPHEMLVAVDALVAGLIVAEAFVGLSFLPLSALTLAAALTVCLWATVATIVASRVGALTPRRALRIAAGTSLLLLALFVAVPWTALP